MTPERVPASDGLKMKGKSGVQLIKEGYFKFAFKAQACLLGSKQRYTRAGSYLLCAVNVYINICKEVPATALLGSLPTHTMLSMVESPIRNIDVHALT